MDINCRGHLLIFFVKKEYTSLLNILTFIQACLLRFVLEYETLIQKGKLMSTKMKDFFWPVRKGEGKLFWGIVSIMGLYQLSHLFLFYPSMILQRNVDFNRPNDWVMTLGQSLNTPSWDFISITGFLLGYLAISNVMRGSRLFLLCLLSLAALLLISFWAGIYGHLPKEIYGLLLNLWQNIGLTIVVMQFVNMIVTSEQSSRLYIFMIFLTILFGTMGEQLLFRYIPTEWRELPHTQWSILSKVGWGSLIVSLIFMTVMARIGYDLTTRVLKASKRDEPCHIPLRESLRIVLSSPYIQWMGGFIISLALVKRGTSFIWLTYKKNIDFFPIAEDSIYLFVGYLGILLLFFLKNIVQWFGWKNAAIFTTVFFLILWLLAFQFPPLPYYQLLLIYAFLREMLYVPLSNELRIKGKIFLDGFLAVALIWLNAEVRLDPYVGIYGAYFLALFGVGLLILSITKLSPLYQKAIK